MLFSVGLATIGVCVFCAAYFGSRTFFVLGMCVSVYFLTSMKKQKENGYENSENNNYFDFLFVGWNDYRKHNKW